MQDLNEALKSPARKRWEAKQAGRPIPSAKKRKAKPKKVKTNGKAKLVKVAKPTKQELPKVKPPKSKASDPATKYATDVVNDRLLAGNWVVKACQRFLDDLKSSEFTYSKEQAAKTIDWFEDNIYLTNGIHAGQKIKLTQWQKFILSNLFAWADEFGHRRFRQAYIETPKGSGKSPIGAGILIYILETDPYVNMDCYIVSSSHKQSGIVYDYIARAAKFNENWSICEGKKDGNLAHQTFHITKDKLFHIQTGSTVTPTYWQRSGSSGPVVHAVVADELHEHYDSTMIDLYRAGLKGEDSLMVVLTNAGEKVDSPVGEEYLYAQKVLGGNKTDDNHFSYIAQLDLSDYEDDQHLDNVDCWHKANPGLCEGVPPINYLKTSINHAKESGVKRAVLDRLNFGRWGTNDCPWIDASLWQKALGKIEYKPKDPCYIGVDLSLNTALTSIFCLWNTKKGLMGQSYSFIPEDGAKELEELHKEPFPRLVAEGEVLTTPGRVIDLDTIAKFLKHIISKNNVQAICCDTYRISEFKDRFSKVGLALTEKKRSDGIWLVPFNQKGLPGSSSIWSTTASSKLMVYLPPAIEQLEGYIKEKKIVIKPSVCLTAAVLGVIVYRDGGGNIRTNKQKSKCLIDPLEAMLASVGLYDTIGLKKQKANHADYDYSDAFDY